MRLVRDMTSAIWQTLNLSFADESLSLRHHMNNPLFIRLVVPERKCANVKISASNAQFFRCTESVLNNRRTESVAINLKAKLSESASFHSGMMGHNSQAPSELVPVASLVIGADDPRKFNKRDSRAAQKIFAKHGQQVDVIVDDENRVIIGHALVIGARAAGIENLSVRRRAGMSQAEVKALSIAYGRLGELGSFETALLGNWLQVIAIDFPDIDVEDMGLTVSEVDIAMGAMNDDGEPDRPIAANNGPTVSVVGDCFNLGSHRLICGSALNAEAYLKLMAGKTAAMILTDPPYGIKIDGGVAGKGRHREFVQGSGDMSDQELVEFFLTSLKEAQRHLAPGALVEICMDWRGMPQLLAAATPLFGKMINMAVWVKDRAGMGSFLRSQYELVLIFRNPGGKHRNNVELGRNGRHRSNVWDYPSAKSFSKASDEGDMLANHPTPKPVRMIADAILDCTKRGDIILEMFCGSGTAIIAAERTGRACYAIELDPIYVDLAVRRWQRWTGEYAIHE